MAEKLALLRDVASPVTEIAFYIGSCLGSEGEPFLTRDISDCEVLSIYGARILLIRLFH